MSTQASYTRPAKPGLPTDSHNRRPTNNGSANSVDRRQPVHTTESVVRRTPPVPKATNGVSPFGIMAHRIANRVAEMAETVTFVERPPLGQQALEIKQQHQSQQISNGRKGPRKLEIRLPNANANGVKFSAPFLDSLLAKMLQLQNRMLVTGQDIAASPADDQIKRDQFEQSAELSRIIALICAEKARQGVEDR